jgi:pimeloyl-ACP methyl ester carboxylesterase
MRGTGVIHMGKQTTIYKHAQAKSFYEKAYDEVLSLWEVPFEATFVNTSFGATHVLIAGEKSAPPLVLLHGMTISSTMWYPNIVELSKQFRIYAVDTIGDLGKSAVSLRCPSNREESARWLDEVVTGLGLEKTNIGGHSMGGFLTTNYTMFYPEKVNKLVLLAPAATFAKIKPQFFTTVFPAVLFPKDFLIRRLWKWFFHKPSQGDEKLFHQFTVGYKNCRPLSSIIPTIYSDVELGKLDVPVLLLIGEHEVIYEPRIALEYAKAHCKNIQAHLIPEASHCLTVEQADMVNQLIVPFLTHDSELQVAATASK